MQIVEFVLAKIKYFMLGYWLNGREGRKDFPRVPKIQVDKEGLFSFLKFFSDSSRVI